MFHGCASLDWISEHPLLVSAYLFSVLDLCTSCITSYICFSFSQNHRINQVARDHCCHLGPTSLLKEDQNQSFPLLHSGFLLLPAPFIREILVFILLFSYLYRLLMLLWSFICIRQGALNCSPADFETPLSEAWAVSWANWLLCSLQFPMSVDSAQNHRQYRSKAIKNFII